MPTHKHVTLKSHHAKPYRKRHVGLFLISLIMFIVLAFALVSYRDRIISGLASSRTFVSNLFPQSDTYKVNISSSYGFNLMYDQKTFFASAISNDTGSLYIGSELSQQRPYTVVRVAPSFVAGANNITSSSSMTLTYRLGKGNANTAPEIAALKDGGIDPASVIRVATSTATIGGNSFQKYTWQSKVSSSVAPALIARFVTYTGLVNGNSFTISIKLGVTGADESAYQPVLDTVSFNNKVSVLDAPNSSVIAKAQASRSLLDTIMNTGIAAATANSVDLTGSEKVAALYSPAVVKLYNAYCMDISIDGTPFGTDFCSAASGSGFFVSQDGYLATNGHVASTTPQDVAISFAVSTYINNADPKSLNYLVNLTSLKPSDIPTNATAVQTLAMIVDALYKLDASRFSATNNVQNLLVQVSPKNPDINALLQDTKNRKTYSASDPSVLKAKLIAADYRAIDGYDGYRASDVAIIKVDGKNFPIVKLGTITSATQGSDLSIIGYPGNASNNGIVDSTSSSATLTTGKVSSIKNALGSSKKLIETDTTIGRGNSGGPAITNSGEVVGIATYTADGSGQGKGVFNYIRDIKDLTDLAAARNITFDTNSATQTAWQEGLANYYSSHYSYALKNFAVVEKLYPNDSKVAELTANAKKQIAAGKDVVDFPLIPVIIVGAVVLAGVGFGLFFIIRHHKKHVIYNAGVAQGTVQAVGTGVGKQTVAVLQHSPTVGPPIVTAPVATPTQTAPSSTLQPQDEPTITTVSAPGEPGGPEGTQVTEDSTSSPKVSEEEPVTNPWFRPDNTQDEPPKK